MLIYINTVSKVFVLLWYQIGYRESWNLTGIGIDYYISGIVTSLLTPSLFPCCTATLDFYTFTL